MKLHPEEVKKSLKKKWVNPPTHQPVDHERLFEDCDAAEKRAAKGLRQRARDSLLSVSCASSASVGEHRSDGDLEADGNPDAESSTRTARRAATRVFLFAWGRGQPKDIIVRGVQIEDGNILCWMSNQETRA